MSMFSAGMCFCMAMLEAAMLLGFEVAEPAGYKAAIFLALMVVNFWMHYTDK